MMQTYGFPEMATIIPKQEGKNGWGINHRIIDKNEVQLARLRSAVGYNPIVGIDRIEQGTYAVLYNSHDLVMSDTWLERDSCYEVINKWEGASGDVLVAGLGLGMIIIPLSHLDTISSITIIEKQQEVIDLVWQHLQPYLGTVPVNLILGDAYAPPLPKKKTQIYDYVWLDIWPDINTDNLASISKLKRIYRKYLKSGGIIRAWMEIRLKSAKRRGY